MRDAVVLGTRLLIFALIAGILLGGAHAVTLEPIERQRQAHAEQARSEVLSAQSFELVEAELASKIKTAYQGMSDGKSAGWVFEVKTVGFAGVMEVMVGVGADGRVSGVKVLSSSETPGLGAKASEPGFGERFIGRMSPVVVSKTGGDDVQAITGATITTQAVADAVEAALAQYAKLEGRQP